MKILTALLVTAIAICSNCNTMVTEKTVNHEMYSISTIEEKNFDSEVTTNTSCHSVTNDLKEPDTMIYQNVVVTPPWSLIDKDVTELAWCNRYVPSSRWSFSPVMASDYLVTEGKIMEILDAFKVEVFHYAYQYNSKNGCFEETGDYFIEPSCSLEDQFFEHADTYYMSLAIYDSNLQIVEIVEIEIPIIYE